MTLQIGAGECIPDASVCDQIPGLDVEYFKYKPSISEDIGAADLVISHAGKNLYILVSCISKIHVGLIVSFYLTLIFIKL